MVSLVLFISHFRVVDEVIALDFFSKVSEVRSRSKSSDTSSLMLPCPDSPRLSLVEETSRFWNQSIVLAGLTGENIRIPSSNPRNYFQAITDPAGCESVVVDGKLFIPEARKPLPLVLIVPGSLGLGDNHIAHAETLINAGFATFLLDPFGSRAIQSTVSNQTPYSFAASAFDVLASLALLAQHENIDPKRISAQGHSRGGSAVLTAAVRSFATPIVGDDVALAGVYAAYPWCGHQFIRPEMGSTLVRAIVGEKDDWLSIQQVQSQVHAIQLLDGTASLRIVDGAAHSFDRTNVVSEIPEASVAPSAPTVYLTGNGAMINPRTGQADTNLTDRELFLAAVKAGFGRRGAHLGGKHGQPEVFKQDMLAFHSSVGHP